MSQNVLNRGGTLGLSCEKLFKAKVLSKSYDAKMEITPRQKLKSGPLNFEAFGVSCSACNTAILDKRFHFVALKQSESTMFHRLST